MHRFAGQATRPALCWIDMEMLAHERVEVSSKRRAGAASAAAERRRLSTAAFYEARAEEYAAATIGLDMSERIARFAGMLPSGCRVLDVGCGAGRDLIGLSAAGLVPVGLDTSPRLVATARSVAGVPVSVGDLRDPPFEPASFGGVWAMASLLHLERSETTTALETIGELLWPGGILFASVKRGSGGACDDDGRWFTLHDERSWERHLRSSGFEILEITGEPPAEDGAVGSVRPGWISSLARRPA
jgi:SAM-dependent methyltransferase